MAFAGIGGPQYLSLPQLIFGVLSKKALGRKMGLKSVCEVREGIKEQPSWENGPGSKNGWSWAGPWLWAKAGVSLIANGSK